MTEAFWFLLKSYHHSGVSLNLKCQYLKVTLTADFEAKTAISWGNAGYPVSRHTWETQRTFERFPITFWWRRAKDHHKNCSDLKQWLPNLWEEDYSSKNASKSYGKDVELHTEEKERESLEGGTIWQMSLRREDPQQHLGLWNWGIMSSERIGPITNEF